MEQSIRLRIGPIIVELVSDYSILSRLHNLYSNFIVCEEANIRLIIRSEHIIYDCADKISFNTMMNDGTMDSSGAYMRASYNFEDKVGVAYFPQRNSDVERNKRILEGIFYYMHVFFTYILFEKGCLLIHASCIVKDGKGHLFAGESGSGKTTIAEKAIKNGMKILGDESICVDVANRKMYSTFFKRNFDSEIADFGSCSFISKALKLEKFPISNMEATYQMMGKVHLLNFLDRTIPIQILRRITNLCSELAKNLPMYIVKSRMEDDVRVMIQ
jgi:hypothetical protein